MMSRLDMRGSISTRLRQTAACANNILIMARTKQTLIERRGKRTWAGCERGKTKYMKCGRSKTN
jgi:hypothetical protein